MKTLFTLCIVFLILPFCYGQDNNDFKTLKNYTLILRADTLIGKYIGEVDRLNVDGHKQNTPEGFGYFIGETKNKEKYVVCKGNWFSGSLYGKNQINFFSNDYYPNLLIDSLDNPKRMTSKKEIWSSLNLDSLINESFTGNFLMNVLESGTGIIKDPKYYYQGEILKWLPHGKGAITFKNDSIKLAGEYFKSTSFEGDFFFGNPAIGTMNFSNNTFLDLIQSMTGNWQEKLFTGNGIVHFSNGTIYEGHWKKGSLEGKGKYNRFDGWEFIGDFNDNQLNKSGNILSPNFQYIGNISNWIPNGTGIMTFLNDTIYLNDTPFINPKFEGEFFLGAMGNGKMFFDRNLNSNKLETQSLVGDWRNKSYSGNGKVNFTDSTFYEGSWKNGKMGGRGKFHRSVGWDYIGEFTNNEISGVGEINSPDYLYNGEILAWKPHGKGIIHFLKDTIYLAGIPFSSQVFEGQFIMGTIAEGKLSFEKKNIVQSLSGDWTNHVYNGKGRLFLYDDLFYDGDWVNSKMEGKGKFEKLKSYIYEGEFTNNKFNGTGTMTNANGWIYEGNWLNGSLDGKCKKTSPKGYSIEGLLSNEKFNGSGVFELQDGTIYSGTMTLENDKISAGEGRLSYPNGDTLHVQWNKDGYIGTGRRIFGSGWIYEGNWLNGSLNGKCKKTSPKGYSIEGLLSNEKFSGSGDFELQDGTIYRGTMTIENEKISGGEGRLSYSNRDTLHVRWDKDGYVGKGRLNFGITENGDSLYEEGIFRNGLLDGQGKKCLLYKLYDYADQEYYLTYTGHFKGGSMHGKGVLYGDGIQGDVSLDGEWVNNNFMKGTMVEEYIVSDEDRTVETYTGEFLNNQRNGQGVLKWDGGTYTGTFVDGFPHGNGKYVYADGRIYEGEMKDGVPNGVGKMTLKNKQVLNGKFEDGEYQKPFSCKEVKIGDQIWMAENLNVSKFRNGDIIPEAKTKSDWIRASQNETPAWSYYNFDEKNGQVYGKLYNWFAVDDSRGLAPEGWHVSSEKEWLTLLEKITPESEMLGSDHFGNAGTKLKSGMLWTLDEFDVKGKDQYGFKAIPGGWVINFINYSDRTSSNFYDINKKASFWTSTGNTFYDNVTRKNLPDWNAACIEITVYESIFPTDEFKINGLSVRCIRD